FFSLDPAHPNGLAPRKRTASTLIPSMYLAGGRPRLVYGTMGGEGQPQTQAALVTRLIDRGLGPQAAVEAPRWLYGRTWGEPTRALRLEARFGEAVADDLALLAYHAAAGLTHLEDVHAAIARQPENDGVVELGEDYATSGLTDWEAAFYPRFLRPEDRVLLVGCGRGRDLLALRERGYRV